MDINRAGSHFKSGEGASAGGPLPRRKSWSGISASLASYSPPTSSFSSSSSFVTFRLAPVRALVPNVLLPSASVENNERYFQQHLRVSSPK